MTRSWLIDAVLEGDTCDTVLWEMRSGILKLDGEDDVTTS